MDAIEKAKQALAKSREMVAYSAQGYTHSGQMTATAQRILKDVDAALSALSQVSEQDAPKDIPAPQPQEPTKCSECGDTGTIRSTDGGAFECYACRDDGNCRSCAGDKCTTGPKCVTLGRDAAPVAAQQQDTNKVREETLYQVGKVLAAQAQYADPDEARIWNLAANLALTSQGVAHSAQAPQQDASAPAQAAEVSWQPGFGLTHEQLARLLASTLKPEEIASNSAKRHDRVGELLHWFARYVDGNANPKWVTQHACELAYYIATNDGNGHIDLEAIRKAAFFEGVNISDAERGTLERIGAVQPKVAASHPQAAPQQEAGQAQEPCACWPGRMCSKVEKCAGQARELPPLPEPGVRWQTHNDESGSFIEGFTADQMREYARAAQAAPAVPHPMEMRKQPPGSYPGCDACECPPGFCQSRGDLFEKAAPAQPTVPEDAADLLDIARTICAVAARARTDSHEHDPSPLSEGSPLLIAAREACVKRGFTADGLAAAAPVAQNKEQQ